MRDQKQLVDELNSKVEALDNAQRNGAHTTAARITGEAIFLINGSSVPIMDHPNLHPMERRFVREAGNYLGRESTRRTILPYL